MSKERPFEDITPVPNIKVGYFEKEEYLKIIDRQEKQIETFAYQIMALQSRIEILEKSQRPQGEWIPVSERLPEENGVYLVTLEYVEDSEIVNEIDMAWFMYSEKDDCNNGFHKAYPIVAWQPLPKPYQKGGAEE